MNMELVVAVGGGLISTMLVINAFFARKTLEKISDVELKLAVLIANHDTTDERSRHNRREIESLRERVHSVEGSNSQVLEYIKSHNN